MENPQKCKNMKNGKVEKWINWQIPKFQNPPTIYFIGKNLWLRKMKSRKNDKSPNMNKWKKTEKWKTGKTEKSLNSKISQASIS